jgi:hypothetical protein
MRDFLCPSCPATFARRYNRDRHFATNHGFGDRAYDCVLCGAVFMNVVQLHQHILTHEPETEYTVIQDLLGGALTTYRKGYLPPTPSIMLTFGADIDNLTHIIAIEAAKKKYAKCSIVLTVEFVQLAGEEILNTVNIHFRCKTFIITPYQDHSAFVTAAHVGFQTNCEDFISNGSNWVISAVYRTEIEFAKCAPLSGSCGLLSINTADDLKKIPIPNEQSDNRCFFYAVAQNFTGSADFNKITAFVNDNLRTDGIQVPVRLCSISKFEELNKHLNIRVNVLYEEDGGVYPIFVSQREGKQKFVNILLYKTVVNDSVVNHYSYIHDLSKLLRRGYKKHSGLSGKSYEKLFVCPNCLCRFSRESELQKHFALCKDNKPQKIILPQPGSFISFKNHLNKFKLPVCAFFDFESCMKTPASSCLSCVNTEKCYHKTSIEAVQTAMTYSLVIVNHENRIIHMNTHSSENAAQDFIQELLDIEPTILAMLDEVKPMNLSPSEERQFQRAKVCHICEDFVTEGQVKVRDHDHITGSYLG